MGNLKQLFIALGYFIPFMMPRGWNYGYLNWQSLIKYHEMLPYLYDV